MKEWLTIDELTKELCITKRTQERLRMERLIPYCKVGRLVRYKRTDIDAWLSNHRVS